MFTISHLRLNSLGKLIVNMHLITFCCILLRANWNDLQVFWHQTQSMQQFFLNVALCAQNLFLIHYAPIGKCTYRVSACAWIARTVYLFMSWPWVARRLTWFTFKSLPPRAVLHQYAHIHMCTIYTHKCMYVFICIHMYVYIFFIYLNCGPMCRLLFMLLPKVCSVLACRKFKLLGLSWLYIISKSKKEKK